MIFSVVLLYIVLVSAGTHASRLTLSCGVNQEARPCTNSCKPTCANYKENSCQSDVCHPPAACTCKDGFVFEDETFNKCVTHDYCETKKNKKRQASGVLDSFCGENQVFRDCSSGCKPTCTDMDVMCATVCGPPACQCKQGFVYEDNTLRSCVSYNYCYVKYRNRKRSPEEERKYSEDDIFPKIADYEKDIYKHNYDPYAS